MRLLRGASIVGAFLVAQSLTALASHAVLVQPAPIAAPVGSSSTVSATVVECYHRAPQSPLQAAEPEPGGATGQLAFDRDCRP